MLFYRYQEIVFHYAYILFFYDSMIKPSMLLTGLRVYITNIGLLLMFTKIVQDIACLSIQVIKINPKHSCPPKEKKLATAL